MACKAICNGNVKNYNTVAVGDTLQSALNRLYR